MLETTAFNVYDLFPTWVAAAAIIAVAYIAKYLLESYSSPPKDFSKIPKSIEYMKAHDNVQHAFQNLEDFHTNDFHKVASIIDEIEKHTTNKNNIQKRACQAQVGIAIASVATCGVASLATPAVPLVKWSANAIHLCLVKKHLTEATELLNMHYQKRNEFISALKDLSDARDSLCGVCPELEGMSFSGLVLAITFPGMLERAATEAAWQAALYAMEEHPDVVINASIETVAFAVDVIGDLGVETTVSVAESVVDAIPFIGLGTSLACLHLANEATTRSCPHTAKIREHYNSSQEHYESMRRWMEDAFKVEK